MGNQHEKIIEKDIGNQVQLFVYRIPKKNHEAMLMLQKQFNNILMNHGTLHVEVFQLTNTETYEGCVNIGNTVSANEDEEIWVELQSHRDLKQMDEVTSQVMKDESCGPLMKQFEELITTGSSLIMGKFSRLSF
jgi:uncharacterized protein YbaA (DUF1428 family)